MWVGLWVASLGFKARVSTYRFRVLGFEGLGFRVLGF